MITWNPSPPGREQFPTPVVQSLPSIIPEAVPCTKVWCPASMPMACSFFSTNFNAGTIDVFVPNGSTGFRSASKQEIQEITADFTDPYLPPGFAPFGIQNIDGDLFVTYAKQHADKHDDVPGPGKGFVDVFD